jgi:hypothetical protein
VTVPAKRRGGLRSPAGGRPKLPGGPGHKVLVTIPQWAMPAIEAQAARMGQPLAAACRAWVLSAALGISVDDPAATSDR